MWNNRNFITDKDKKTCLVSIVFCVIDLFLHGILYNKFKYNDYAVLVDIFSLTLLSFSLMLLLLVYLDGYKLKQGQLQYRKTFFKHDIAYEEIGSVIISNAMSTGKYYTIGKWKIVSGKLVYLVYPWLTFVKTDDVKTEWPEELNSWKVQKLIDEEINIYGLVWNDKHMGDFLSNYKGKYYIADSIRNRYAAEIEKIIEKYNIDKSKVFTIYDTKECCDKL